MSEWIPGLEYAEGVVEGKITAWKYVRLACERFLRDLEEGTARGLVYDVAAAQRACRFFPRFLRHAEGQFAGKPFELLPFQEFIVGQLFGWLTSDGYRRFRTAYIEMGKGNGKALALDTPIPTPTGWVVMGALKVGDEVFDETGARCQVTATSEVMVGRPCYRVRFADGCEIVADAEHLWQTAALRSGGARGPKPADAPRKGGYGIRTTEEIAATVAVGSVHPQAKWNHRVDVAGALDLPPVALPVPPYTLGAWLGDGDSDCARLTMAYSDAEIAEAIRSEGIEVTERREHSATTARLLLGSGGRSQDARNNSLQARLRALDVLGDKHIPTQYLRASQGQRLALLQGLLDTDGSALKSGRVEFTSCSEKLAVGVVELIRSLGYKPTISEGNALLRGRVVGRRWRVLFHPYRGSMVFRLPRKNARLVERPGTRPLSEGRMIVACDRVRSVPVRCISVSSTSQLFLAGRGMVPTHNSPLAAGIGLYMLAADGEPSAEVYAAAVTRDQARIMFTDAQKMVEASPELARAIDNKVNNLAHLRSGSFFRPVSSEGRSLDGKRPHCALIDEVHEHPRPIVVDKMRAGTKSRRQALIFEITNSGYDRQSVCYQHHDFSCKVLEGVVENDTWFAFVCGLDAGDDWKDPAVWPKANPSLGKILQHKYFEEQVAEAEGMPAKASLVQRLNFCVWTEQSARWIDLGVWDENVETDAADLEEELAGRRCFGGIDLASTRDLSALVWVFPPEDVGASLEALEEGDQEELERWKVLARFFCPELALWERVKRDRVSYDVWLRDGWLTATPGDVTDYAWIRSQVHEDAERFDVVEIAHDRWNSSQLVGELIDDGLELVAFGQGFASMSTPCRELERLLHGRALDHGENPIMRWMATNVSAKQDPAGNLKPDKSTSTERIDGIVALLMALGRAVVQPDGGMSVYEREDRGFLTV